MGEFQRKLMGDGSSRSSSNARVDVKDEQAARKVLADFVESWNRHDMRAFADVFTKDCDYIVISGRHLKGRDPSRIVQGSPVGSDME